MDTRRRAERVTSFETPGKKERGGEGRGRHFIAPDRNVFEYRRYLPTSLPLPRWPRVSFHLTIETELHDSWTIVLEMDFFRDRLKFV